MKISLLLLIFSLFSLPLLMAQDTTLTAEKSIIYDKGSEINKVEFEEEAISEYLEDEAFNYLDAEGNDNWWTRFKRWLDAQYRAFLGWLFGDYEANTFFQVIFKILPYLLLMLVSFFVVWIFMRLNPGDNFLADPEEPAVFLSEDEKIIKSENIGELIEKAITAGDYRLAVRYYYLQILRLLNQKELITYEFQKTDSDYLHELKKEQFRPQLKKLMRLYDFIWYGNFSISESDFRLTQQSFQQFQNGLKSSGNE